VLYDSNNFSSNTPTNDLAERNGREKLYVPVEQPITETTLPIRPPQLSQDEDTMHLDDTKHKVYIYDLDAELSDSESDDGKLVFLPDIQKHLRESRIPPSILANSEGELAGNTQQLVLYNVPSSLSVPEEQDSVRRAIIETRARVRARQAEDRIDRTPNTGPSMIAANGVSELKDWYQERANGHASVSGEGSKKYPPVSAYPAAQPYRQYSQQGYPIPPMDLAAQNMPDDDPDAMDLG
jgi:hypothetical protein